MQRATEIDEQVSRTMEIHRVFLNVDIDSADVSTGAGVEAGII